MSYATCVEARPPHPLRQSAAGTEAARAWTIIAGSASAARDVLYNETGVARGTVYQDHLGNVPDSFCICLDISVDDLVPATSGGDGLFRVSAEYAYPRRTRIPPAEPRLDGAPRYRMERTLVWRTVDHDVLGNPIVNVVDEPLDPPSSAPLVERVLVIEWVVFAANYQTVELAYGWYEGRTNEYTYSGAPPGCLLCAEMHIEDLELQFGGLCAFRLTARLAYRPPQEIGGQTFEGWQEVRENRGRRYYAGVGADPPYIDFPNRETRRLDWGGQPLAVGAPSVWLSWYHCLSADFNAWGV